MGAFPSPIHPHTMKKHRIVGLAVGLLLVGLSGCATRQTTRGLENLSAETTATGRVSEKRMLADERYTVGGFPRASSPTLLLENVGYAVGFSESTLNPLWAAYYCGPLETFPFADDRPEFADDERVPAASRLVHDDYNRPKDANGEYIPPLYDRGHMAPNYAIGTRYGEAARKRTFVMTNVVPQRSTMNSQTWKALEAEIARNFAPALKGVWVVVGPVFTEPTTRYNGRAVIPSAVYCIVLDRVEGGGLRALSLSMDQTVSGKRRIGDFFTTIDSLESRTGLDFFPGLPDAAEAALESAMPDSGWNADLELNPNKRWKGPHSLRPVSYRRAGRL